MSRSRALRVVVVAAAAAAASSASAATAAPPAPPKHVLFVVVDDLGFSDLSYKARTPPWDQNLTGAPLFPTPNIDALAMGGVRLESMYVQYLCSPSRGAFLSGRYAYTNQMNAGVIVNGQPDQLPTNVRTTADLLSAHGWATAAFGKWDLGMTTWGCTPNCRGFDYWAGFYDAYNDYFTHRPTPAGLDLRLDYAPDTANGNETGIYFTHLLTMRVAQWANETAATRPGAPTFAYVAQQAIHAPQQVPASYLGGGCSLIPEDQPIRRMACGQMRAVDESVGLILDTYQRLGWLNDTLVILTADNGGNTDTGGSNFPLRGMKATMFEGGMRAAAFVSGAGLAPSVRGSINRELYSLVDWLPSIVQGIAGIDLAEAALPKYPYQPAPPPLDGMDVWGSISTGAPSPRTEVLLNLAPQCFSGVDPATKLPPPCDIHGAGAYLVARGAARYKLLHGHVGEYAGPGNISTAFCGPHDGVVQPHTLPLKSTPATTPPFCPTGWVPPPGMPGMPAAIPPADAASCAGGIPCTLWGSPYLQGGTWLFDVAADPFEQRDLSSSSPEIVAQLMALLQKWNATGIPQRNDPNDPASDPARFGGIWTPWQGDPLPQHCDPNATVPNKTAAATTTTAGHGQAPAAASQVHVQVPVDAEVDAEALLEAYLRS